MRHIGLHLFLFTLVSFPVWGQEDAQQEIQRAIQLGEQGQFAQVIELIKPLTSAATLSTTSRQNSCGICALNSGFDIPYSAREGMAPLLPGPGNHSRWKWRFAKVIAASKRMTGNRRATCRMVWMTCSRTAGLR